MFEQPADWDRLSSSERREARFAAWMSTAGKEFATDAARATYAERVQRVKDIVDLKTPDRVPLLPFIGGYFANYAGITPHDVMYDYDKYAMAWKKFHLDFGMDYNMFSGAFNPGKVLDILDYKVYQWPGHGIAPTDGFQALEEEYMHEDEYDLFIADPEAYYMKVYMPRAFGALAGFGMLPTFFATMELPFIPAMMVPVGIPPVQAAFKAFIEAGQAALEWAEAAGAVDAELQSQHGLAFLPGGFTKAPFDWIGDTLRGTRGVMLDLFRQPDKVLAAVDALVPIAIKVGVDTATGRNNPFCFIPLHKGADGFMSDANFKTYYWPTWKKVILGLIDAGLVPFHLVEGGYNARLDVIVDDDIPAGSTYWNFDQTDMKVAKQKMGGWAAIAGNVPSSILHAGSVKQVEDCVKGLIDDAGADGGYAMAGGAVLDHARAENLHAMIETTKTYGVYS
jgi:Uroporphyrinogen decarboxylase (URO-D)